MVMGREGAGLMDSFFSCPIFPKQIAYSTMAESLSWIPLISSKIPGAVLNMESTHCHICVVIFRKYLLNIKFSRLRGKYGNHVSNLTFFLLPFPLCLIDLNAHLLYLHWFNFSKTSHTQNLYIACQRLFDVCFCAFCILCISRSCAFYILV